MLLEKELATFKETHTLVGVYCDDYNVDRFQVGYVLETDENYCFMSLITTTGEDDGYLLFDLSHIFAIEDGSAYLETILKLNQCRNKERKNESVKKKLTHTKNLMADFLDLVRNQGWMVEFNLFDSQEWNFQGIVEEVDDEMCCVLQIDGYGNTDGKTKILLNSISQIRAHNVYLKTVETLRNLS